MKRRTLGKTGYSISEVSLGTWQVGGGWGKDFDAAKAERILETAVESGVNFFDTADVYDGGQSEAVVAKVARRHRDTVFVATKCGRKLKPHVSASYTPAAVRAFVDDSLTNSGLDALHLLQLHCPPTDVYYRPEIFEVLSDLIDEGKVLNAGVSVERVEEALKAIEFDVVSSVQIVFNLFRHRPAERFFSEAVRRNVGVIARVPLASGLLTGKFHEDSTFEAGDHRNFNRNGEAFDRGETFSGVDYETGVRTVEEIAALLGTDVPLAQRALQWILSWPEVSTVIPGASSVDQVLSNCRASELGPLDEETVTKLRAVYDREIRPLVHQRW